MFYQKFLMLCDACCYNELLCQTFNAVPLIVKLTLAKELNWLLWVRWNFAVVVVISSICFSIKELK